MIIFATANPHKAREVEQMLGEEFSVASLADYGITEEIPEDQPTLEGNASQKAWWVYNRTGVDCFADDTGLEVEALGGEPGVLSARYAGEEKNSAANIQKLLTKLEGSSNRRARFRTVISLIEGGVERRFEGVVNGVITGELYGEGGFGYDPVFRPEGYDVTFAQMDSASKNAMSHRGRAVEKLIEYLKNR